MLFITFAFAYPLFILLRKRAWLNWWHAFLAGAFCGMCYIALDFMLSYSRELDNIINRNNIYYVALGASIGLIFWWIGIFKNKELPFVSSRFPWSIVAVFPIYASVFFAHQALQVNFHEGKVISVLKESNSQSVKGLVSVRLTGGAIVQAYFEDRPSSFIVGKCFHLDEYWSNFQFKRVYRLVVQFGGDANEC